MRAALFACAALIAAPVAAQGRLVAETREGVEIGHLAFGPGQEICLTWAHSVTGGRVADCFAHRDGRLVLARSYLHDFAAGLGEIPGRGTLRSASGGGYWIDGIDEAIPGDALFLRVGAPRVGHVLSSAADRLDLSARVPGTRVTLRLVPQAAGIDTPPRASTGPVP